jgi:hypothetical protein
MEVAPRWLDRIFGDVGKHMAEIVLRVNPLSVAVPMSE